VTYVINKEAARKCGGGLKGAYNYEGGGENEGSGKRGVASNIEKDV